MGPWGPMDIAGIVKETKGLITEYIMSIPGFHTRSIYIYICIYICLRDRVQEALYRGVYRFRV